VWIRTPFHTRFELNADGKNLTSLPELKCRETPSKRVNAPNGVCAKLVSQSGFS
jgi:hypothetical protein